MAYGIHVLNSSGRTIIDTSNPGSLFYAGPSGTAVAETDFPTPNWTETKLILARPASTAVGSGSPSGTTHENGKPQLGIQMFTFNWGPQAQGFPSSSNGNGGGYVVWRELKAQSTASLTPSVNGLVVYDGQGTGSSNILLSASDLDVSATLVASGKFNGTATDNDRHPRSFTEFTMDPSLDQGRYYALVTGTVSLALPAFGGYIQTHYNFEFDYAAGKIRVLNYASAYGPQPSSDMSNKDWAIFYLRNGGSVDDNFS